MEWVVTVVGILLVKWWRCLKVFSCSLIYAMAANVWCIRVLVCFAEFRCGSWFESTVAGASCSSRDPAGHGEPPTDPPPHHYAAASPPMTFPAL